MTLNNIKQLRKDRGFTIVELLIVIIVIAILAAIVIVAYNNVTQKANASKAQTSAVSVQKKAEAFNADNSTGAGNGQYPATAAAWNSYTSSNQGAVGAIPSGVTVQAGDAANGQTTTVRYVSCTAGGAVVGYYLDYFDQSKGKLVYLVGGTTIAAGSATDNTVAPVTTGCTLSTT